jgi:sialate O-acetylesterase
VPIGLIHASWGGTRIQAWMSPEALASCSGDAVAESSSYDEDSLSFKHNNMTTTNDPNAPTVLYNAMVHPFLPLSIRTTLWYQGESNAGEPQYYQCAQPAMINDWRQRFENSKASSFFFVQLAAYNANGSWGDFRWFGQTLSLGRMQPAGMAIAIDGADPASPHHPIHPRGKLELAQRLERVAAVVEYRFALVQSQGPVALSITRQASLTGEMSYNVQLNEAGYFVDPPGCVTCCANGWVFEGYVGNQWKPMTTMNLSGSNIVLTMNQSANDPAVSSVRYAWAMLPECVLMSASDPLLPAAPFVMAVV